MRFGEHLLTFVSPMRNLAFTPGPVAPMVSLTLATSVVDLATGRGKAALTIRISRLESSCPSDRTAAGSSSPGELKGGLASYAWSGSSTSTSPLIVLQSSRVVRGRLKCTLSLAVAGL